MRTPIITVSMCWGPYVIPTYNTEKLASGQLLLRVPPEVHPAVLIRHKLPVKALTNGQLMFSVWLGRFDWKETLAFNCIG